MNDYGLHVLQASWQALEGLLGELSGEPVAAGASLVALAGLGARLLLARSSPPPTPAPPAAPFACDARPLSGSAAAAQAVAGAAAPAARGLLALETPGGGE